MGLQAHHLLEQVHSIYIEGALLHMLGQWDAFPLREGVLEVLELNRVRPVVLIRSALHTEDLEYLSNLGVSSKQRT